jgi:hypothetical protein
MLEIYSEKKEPCSNLEVDAERDIRKAYNRFKTDDRRLLVKTILFVDETYPDRRKGILLLAMWIAYESALNSCLIMMHIYRGKEGRCLYVTTFFKKLRIGMAENPCSLMVLAGMMMLANG